MGEDRPDANRPPTGRRVTVQEAAELLGLTVEAVRGRIKRGKLEHTKEDGAVFVILDTDQTATGPTGQRPVEEPDTDQSERVEDLKEQIAHLRLQLEEEREARRRADTILAQLAAANAEQARTIRAIEAPQGAPGAPQAPAEGSEGMNTPDAGVGPQEGSEPRPWWRRWLGR